MKSNFIEKTMKTRRVELAAEGKKLSRKKSTKEVFFQEDTQSPLPIIIIMPLKHILRKCTAG